LKNLNFILFSKEVYGNTDWINHINNINKYSNYNTVFFGKGIFDGKLYYAKENITSKSFFILFIRFIKKIYTIRNCSNIIVIRFNKYNLIVIFYLYFYKIFNYNISYYLDVRTLYTESNNKINKFIFDSFIKVSSKFYDNTLIINSLIANKLNLKKFIILPLGIDKNVIKINHESNCQNNQIIKFVYVGKIRQDFHLFLSKYIDIVNIKSLPFTLDIYSYHINDKIDNLISKNTNILSYKGILNRDLFMLIMSNYQVGISPLPLSNIFDLQPHTKLYEYLQSGLPFITKNTEGVSDQFKSIIPGWIYNDLNDLELILSNIITEYDLKKDLINLIKIDTWEDIYKNVIVNLFNK